MHWQSQAAETTHVGITVPQQRKPMNMNPNPNFAASSPHQYPLQFLPLQLGSSSSSSSSSFSAGASSASYGFLNPALPSRNSAASSSYGIEDFETELPLLEELGIDMGAISRKMLSAMNPVRINVSLHQNSDLAGPFLICMALGLCQLLSGRFQFGLILGWTCMASIFLYVVVNMLAGKDGNLDLYRCMSVVGYSMVPLLVLSLIFVVVPYQGIISLGLAGVFVLWCTRLCTELLLSSHVDLCWSLIAYACSLVFMFFSLLIIF